MKYWTQLNELDDAVYKVQAVNSGLQIFGRTDEMTSADSGLPEEFQTFLADLNDRMDEAVKNLKDKFQNVWDVVREDTFEDNMRAIDELEEDQNASKRFDQILSNLPTMNSIDSYIVAGAMDDLGVTAGNLDQYFNLDFTFDPASENSLAEIKIDWTEDHLNTSFQSDR